jgi:hypothetical protein
MTDSDSVSSTLLAFATKHAELLEIEREAELQQALTEANAISNREARLMVDGTSTGPAGRTVAILKRRSGLPLVLGRISVGDVVCIRPVSEGGVSNSATAFSAGKFPRGVVSRITDLAVTVSLDSNNGDDEKDDDNVDDGEVSIHSAEMSSVYLVRLANDVTYERMREILRALPSMAQRRVVQVAFGVAQPRFLAEASTSPLSVLDKGLNESQIDAVEFAMHSSDIALIHGPPGTGKVSKSHMLSGA